MSLEFYDRHGQPCLYSEDNETLYAWDGVPIAYLYGQHVYLFSGQHLGWFKKGWVNDNQGYRVYFTQRAVGGPLRPTKRAKPFKQIKQPVPDKQEREPLPLEPLAKNAWAEYAW